MQLSPIAVPTLLVRLNYNGVVTDVRTPEPNNVASLADPPPKIAHFLISGPKLSGVRPVKSLSCKGVSLVPAQPSESGYPFCVSGTTDALTVAFQSRTAAPYATQKTVTCTPLNDASSHSAIFSVYARVGRDASGEIVYDGGRAKCDLDPGFDYAYTVEKQSAAQLVSADALGQTRTISIPWSLLHLDDHSRSIMLNAGGYQFIIPLKVFEGGASISSDFAPYVRVSTPSPGSQAVRSRDVEFNFALSPNRHHLLLASFAQNQSTVSVQRALSNALSLAPVSLGSPARMAIGQDLQAQSQTLFTFLQPSVFLEDQTLKGLFDSTPFSVNKLSGLASGYAYGFSSDPFTAGAFYGLQSPGSYSGGTTATFILTTPAPSPEPAPQFARAATANEAPQHQALRPPPPPGPYFESGTESTPPLELAFTNAFNGSKGARDVLDALAFETHLYHNQSSSGSDYSAQTFNLFGRLEHDFHTPAATAPGSISQFIGESATFTTSSASNRYFQVRETAGVQLNDRFFTPTSGSATWLTPLSGPVAHLTAAFAAGKKAHYYALDLIGFRLTNAAGDLAAQEGWQFTIPLADPGWLLSGGTLTQTVSDRIAAINQGLISGYSAAITQVPSTLARPQRLANVSVLSPNLDIGANWKLDLAAGYNTGTVTACGAASSGRNAKYQCLTVVDNRTVGGISLSHGNLLIGATDTAIQSGALSAGNAARNFGTSGGLPGSVTGYVSLQGCPQVSAAYANAAMVNGIPFPQQGSTLSSQLDYPLAFYNERFDIVLGYFNERALTNPSFNDSGFSAVIRLGTSFGAVPRCPTKGG